jgi:hypothetical protein
MAAVIVKTVVANGVEFRLTEKGAVSLYQAVSGRYIDTLKPSTLRAMADSGHPICQDLVNSPEFDRIQNNWALSKEQNKLQKQIAKLELEAQQRLQAIADLKRASGQ